MHPEIIITIINNNNTLHNTIIHFIIIIHYIISKVRETIDFQLPEGREGSPKLIERARVLLL